MHRLFVLPMFLLLVSSSITLAAEPTDLEKIQGRWIVESAIVGGKPRDLNSGVEHEFSKTKLLIRELKAITSATLSPNKSILETPIVEEDRLHEIGFVIDDKKQPKQFDFIVKGKVLTQGIYEFRNGKLFYCQSRPDKPRPTEFTSTKENIQHLVTLKRPKKK